MRNINFHQPDVPMLIPSSFDNSCNSFQIHVPEFPCLIFYYITFELPCLDFKLCIVINYQYLFFILNIKIRTADILIDIQAK